MITINLLPVREERRRAALRQLVIALGATLVGSVVLAVLVHGVMATRLSNAEESVAATKAEIERFTPQLQQVEKYRKTKADIEQKLAVIDELSDARSGPAHIFDELASHTPERVWVTKVEVEKGKIEISGVSLDNELVALFLTALEDSPYFKEVELAETEAQEKNGFKLNAFTVSAMVTSPAAEKRAAEKAAEPQPQQTASAGAAPAAGR
jgi:type IV pilus assembly protein PilN